MFATLPETKTRGERSRWGSATSVAVHAGVVLLAVYGTSTAKPAIAKRLGDGPVVYIQPPPRETNRGGASATAGGLLAPPLLPPRVSPKTIDVGVTSSVYAPFPAFRDTSLVGEIERGGAAGAAGAPGTPGGTGLTSESAVDVPVAVVVERKPRYPDGLRAAGVEGTVVLRFVVDTTGRAELSTVRIVSSTQEQFTGAVLAALRQTRFVPGRIHDRTVPTLVERSYRFALEGQP